MTNNLTLEKLKKMWKPSLWERITAPYGSLKEEKKNFYSKLIYAEECLKFQSSELILAILINYTESKYHWWQSVLKHRQGDLWAYGIVEAQDVIGMLKYSLELLYDELNTYMQELDSKPSESFIAWKT